MLDGTRLEALLFTQGGEMRKSDIVNTFGIAEEELADAIMATRANLTDRGIVLVETDTSVSLRTAPQHADFIADFQKKNREKDIGQAGLEVLAIVLYKDTATQATIDFIRGVNSSSTLRTLLVRGLLERVRNPDDARQWVYQPSSELLAHLGLASTSDVPDRDEIREKLNTFETQYNTSPDINHGTHE